MGAAQPLHETTNWGVVSITILVLVLLFLLALALYLRTFRGDRDRYAGLFSNDRQDDDGN